MLARFRIEVEGAESASQCEEELNKYEHALQVAEAQRYGIGYEATETVTEGRSSGSVKSASFEPWSATTAERDFYNEQLGRKVTDEVIEYDSTMPGYRGRRVVHFKRVDTRERSTRPIVQE